MPNGFPAMISKQNKSYHKGKVNHDMIQASDYQIIHNHLWDTNSEPINKSTLSRTLDNGGVNILNISNQNQSLLIKHTLQITNPNNNNPWVFFMNLCKSWNFLKNNNSKPKYIGSNIPIYYQKQVKATVKSFCMIF